MNGEIEENKKILVKSVTVKFPEGFILEEMVHK